jgi:hypothetical protein
MLWIVRYKPDEPGRKYNNRQKRTSPDEPIVGLTILLFQKQTFSE